METEIDNIAEGTEVQEEPRLTDPWYMPSFTQTIELADGSVLNGSASLNVDVDDLWIWLESETSFQEAFLVFSDAQKTSIITSHITSIETKSWSGYTDMTLIKINDGKVTVRMRKPSNATN